MSVKGFPAVGNPGYGILFILLNRYESGKLLKFLLTKYPDATL